MSAHRDDPQLQGVRVALEQSLLALADRRDLADITASLSEAVALLSRFLEAGPDDLEALDGLERATLTVEASRDRLAPDDATARRLDSTARALTDVLGRLQRRAPLRALEGTRRSDEILASVGLPRLHHVDVPAPRLLARDADAAAEVRRSLGAGAPVTGDLAQVRAIARDCFEDLASLGSLRRLHDVEPWIDAAPFEQRLLDNLDALIALERPLDPGAPPVGLVDALFAYATEWLIPDYGRTFALAFTLSCLATETAMRWVVLALRRSHPRTHPAFVDAFALGSSDAIDRTLIELCADDDAAIVAVALSAMARRGRPDVASTVLVLMRPAPALVEAATDLAARLPATVALPLLGRLLEGESPVAAASAAAALATLGDARGAKHLRGVLQGAASGGEPARRIAFETLCLIGSPLDRQILVAEAGADPARLAWLAWHGDPDHVPLLIEALRRALVSGAPGDTTEPLARALERIGGGAPPRPTGFGTDDLEARLDAWRRAFEERRPIDATRLRGGLAWTPQAIVAELSAHATKQLERPLLARELALVTKRAVHVDVTGWVAAQEQQLSACQALVERSIS